MVAKCKTHPSDIIVSFTFFIQPHNITNSPQLTFHFGFPSLAFLLSRSDLLLGSAVTRRSSDVLSTLREWPRSLTGSRKLKRELELFGDTGGSLATPLNTRAVISLFKSSPPRDIESDSDSVFTSSRITLDVE